MLEYTDIHKNFIKIVDVKLDGFCAEFGIDHATFLQACSKITQKIHK